VDRARLSTFGELRGRILAYVGDHQNARAVAESAEGVILHGSKGFKAGRALAVVSDLGIDPARYADDRNRTTDQLFSDPPRVAIRSQLFSGATFALSDSRFSTDRSADAMRGALQRGREFVDAASDIDSTMAAFSTLVIRFDELKSRQWISPVSDFAIPLATVFASRGDPFSDEQALEGAIELVRSTENVFVMRCDLSSIGLIACGATASAVGASSSVRHLWLPTKRRGDVSGATGHVFVPKLAAWVKLRFIEYAMAEPAIDPLMRCDCAVCGPQGDVRSLIMPGVSSAHRELHSVAAVTRLGREVLDADNPLVAWRVVCVRATDAYGHLAELGLGVFQAPAMLQNWITLI